MLEALLYKKRASKMLMKLGDRQILEKPIPQISENGKVRVIVEKKKIWQICEIAETKMAKSVL